MRHLKKAIVLLILLALVACQSNPVNPGAVWDQSQWDQANWQ